MPDQQIINQIIDRVNDFNRRVRDLEEKIRNLNARVNTLDDTVLEKNKDLSGDIQDLEDEMEQLRDRIANMEVDIKEVNREKRKYVTSSEIEEIENYMELMNPINSSFVTETQLEKKVNDSLTQDEVEQIVERKLKNQQEQD
ncbi:hypothetical protein HRED_01706 [Candidatus Haloredivivus sp. G17]|jgi:uncharacterized protein YoxC|nr:hypothetical protein HRED_01706 [Candidatus Haloredivivus sp. G17]